MALLVQQDAGDLKDIFRHFRLSAKVTAQVIVQLTFVALDQRGKQVAITGDAVFEEQLLVRPLFPINRAGDLLIADSRAWDRPRE